MKNLLPCFGILIMLLITGCGRDQEAASPKIVENELVSSDITGRWQLKQIVFHAQIYGQKDSYETPDYQDVYEFHADGSFERYRSSGQSSKGTFVISKEADMVVIRATHANKALACHDFFSNKLCPQEGKSYFVQTEPGVLRESYMASDGPSYIYQKIAAKD